MLKVVKNVRWAIKNGIAMKNPRGQERKKSGSAVGRGLSKFGLGGLWQTKQCNQGRLCNEQRRG